MMVIRSANSLDSDEVRKFEQIAADWWNPSGAFKPLHQINPLRMQYIREHASLSRKHVLDVGCGGGLLCEAMARDGADVTGIDAGANTIAAAKLHLQESKLNIYYQRQTAEQLAETSTASYDIVTCFELLEHVTDPTIVIAACAHLVKPAGHVFFSTINRNLKSFLGAIVAGEYIFRLLPKGTHNYHKLIKPSELTDAARKAGLHATDYTGIGYNPLLRNYHMTSNIDINYLVHFVKPR